MRVGRDFVDYDYEGPFSTWYFATHVPDLKKREYRFFSPEGLVKSNFANQMGHCPPHLRIKIVSLRLQGMEGVIEEKPEDGMLRMRIASREDPFKVPFFVHHLGREVSIPTPVEILPYAMFAFTLDDFTGRGKPLTLTMGVREWKAK